MRRRPLDRLVPFPRTELEHGFDARAAARDLAIRGEHPRRIDQHLLDRPRVSVAQRDAERVRERVVELAPGVGIVGGPVDRAGRHALDGPAERVRH